MSAREQLLHAALTRFAVEPPVAVRLEDIRREAGVSVGALYHHFPDKAALVEQLSNVVDLTMKNDQAATFSSVVVVSLSATFTPSLNFTPSSTSLTSSWPLNRRQRSWAASSSL